MVTTTLTAPNGKSQSQVETATLPPGEMLARTATVTVDGPKGTYTLVVSADDGSGASTATTEATRVTK